jgi:hypothetical protein
VSRPGLVDRESQLLDEHRRRWRKQLRSIPGLLWGRFCRGFVGHVAAWDSAVVCQNADRLFAAQPVQEVDLPRHCDRGQLLDLPQAGQLTRLGLGLLPEGWAGVEALVTSPRLTRLTGLTLYGWGTALPPIDNPRLSRFTSLRLHRVRLGDENARTLARSPLLEGLRSLEVEHCGLTQQGLGALLGGLGLKCLRELRLEGNPLGDHHVALWKLEGLARRRRT